jgi:hypothetical protein
MSAKTYEDSRPPMFTEKTNIRWNFWQFLSGSVIVGCALCSAGYVVGRFIDTMHKKMTTSVDKVSDSVDALRIELHASVASLNLKMDGVASDRWTRSDSIDAAQLFKEKNPTINILTPSEYRTIHQRNVEQKAMDKPQSAVPSGIRTASD